jgi:alpha-amylase
MELPRVCYEIFVRSFCDSNGDGIGDLNGITSRLDYLQDLGVEALWLTPIHPSPSYHKYDVTDYYRVEPEYGTLDDFRQLLADAHSRSIHVYLDLVINHTSTRHPWFRAARSGTSTPFRSFYWWHSPQEIQERGIGRRQLTADSWEANPWHHNRGDAEKYYGMFTHRMPDLNYDSPTLREELFKIVDFWLNDVGVDGFRLDAARHIYPYWLKDRNPSFWEEFGRRIEELKPGVYTVGEVWADAHEVAPYFRGLKANFHFDLSYALQHILVQGTHQELVRKLLEDYAVFSACNPAFVDAIMLTNHDQERIGSVVQGQPDKMKLAASLLLTLPGQPYLYYGEEIGMLGKKPDPRIREPFLWTDQPHDPQRPRWIRPYYSRRSTVRPLSVQQQDPTSLYHHYQKLIALRKAEPALGQIRYPNLAETPFTDPRVLAFLRPHPDRPLLVVHNLSGQPLEVLLPGELGYFTQLLFQTQPGRVLDDEKLLLAPLTTLVLGRPGTGGTLG